MELLGAGSALPETSRIPRRNRIYILKGLKDMLYILAGIVASVALIGAAEVVVRIWDRLVPPEGDTDET